jgi:hypothetical protein
MVKTISMFNEPTTLPQQSPTFNKPLPNLPLQPKCDRLNQRCGCYDLDHHGNIILMSSHKMSLIHLQYLNTTRSNISTLKNKPTARSRQPNGWRNASQRAVQSSTWTLASRGPPQKIINNPIRLRTAWSCHMMDTPHILSLLMAPLAGFGYSLPKQKNLLLTFSGPLCQNLAWLKVLSELIRAVSLHKVVHSEI